MGDNDNLEHDTAEDDGYVPPVVIPSAPRIPVSDSAEQPWLHPDNPAIWEGDYDDD